MRRDYRPCILMGGGWTGVFGAFRSLGPRGVPVHALALDEEDVPIYGASRYCRSVLAIPAETNGQEFCDRATRWMAKHHRGARPVLLPMNDRAATIVAENREAFDEAFDVVMADSDLILAMLDKPRANALAQANGLVIPLSETVRTEQELAEAVGRLKWPAILKPTWWRTRGEFPFKAVVCNDAASSLRTGRELLAAGAELVLQEYIAGEDTNVLVYMFYRSRDGKTFGSTGIKLRQVPPGTGNMAYGQALQLPRMAEASRKFLDAVDYRGLGGIEYKRHDGKDYFIEMSVRPEGFHALSIAAGVDTPWLAYQDAALGSLPPACPPQRSAYWIDELSCFRLWYRYWGRAPVLWDMLKLVLKGNLHWAAWWTRDFGPVMRVWTWLAGRALRRLRRAVVDLWRPPGDAAPLVSTTEADWPPEGRAWARRPYLR